MYFDQREFDIRCEWGESGLKQLIDFCDVLIIVDVLSFTSAVDVAVSRGAVVFPYPYKGEQAQAYAREKDALLAGAAGLEYHLSPHSLRNIPAGTRLVLPSPNGSWLSWLAGHKTTIAGCLRNAAAVAREAQKAGRKIGVIPAGERWPDGSLRPGIEDLLGAGAIIQGLSGTRSPEAETALAVFERFQADLYSAVAGCSSGKELIGRGRGYDVELSAKLHCSTSIPWLIDGAYRHKPG